MASMNRKQLGSRKIVLWCVSAFAVLFLFVRMGAQTKAPGFSGEYDDPNHTNCIRRIKVSADGIHAYVSGTDGYPGCPRDGSGKAWGLDGIVRSPDTIIVDFSPKGGPKGLEGKIIKAGILWEDQNIWSKKTFNSDDDDIFSDISEPTKDELALQSKTPHDVRTVRRS